MVPSETGCDFGDVFINKTCLGSPASAVGFRDHWYELDALLTAVGTGVEKIAFTSSIGSCGRAAIAERILNGADPKAGCAREIKGGWFTQSPRW